MCGLAGYFAFHGGLKIERDQLVRMTESMRHRGPNDHGHVLYNREQSSASFFRNADDPAALRSGDIGLGFQRLSILDLSPAGNQPIHDPTSGTWMVFNGEVYNFLELRSELERFGHIFKTKTDTEVVLKSYLQWGLACFERFNGMWGVAIYDSIRDLLILSRDRFGKKPLYFHAGAKGVFFASEIKALLANPLIPKSMNLSKIANYAGRHYRYVDAVEDSFFAGIDQVPKAGILTFAANGHCERTRFWHLAPGNFPFTSDADAVAAFRHLLADAVRIRLRTDVPLATMLSGGLDSTSVTALAALNNPGLRTFSGVTGDDPYFDETEFIEAVVQYSQVDSTFVRPKPADVVSTINSMLRYHDEPVCTVSWYTLFLINKLIADHGVPVILTGHGGDELLAGYWYHFHYHFADLRDQGSDADEVAAWRRVHGRPADEYQINHEYLSRLRKDRRLEVEKHSQYVDCLSADLRSELRDPVVESPFAGALNRRLFCEINYEAVPAVVRAEDRNSMANSIESRAPFLDYRLAEFCFSLPNRFKIRDGMSKWILREAMKGILPEKVRLRTDKVGFNAPIDDWLRQEMRVEVAALVAQDSFVNRHIYDRAKLQATFAEHQSGTRNHGVFFWQYVNIALWYAQHFGNN